MLVTIKIKNLLFYGLVWQTKANLQYFNGCGSEQGRKPKKGTYYEKNKELRTQRMFKERRERGERERREREERTSEENLKKNPKNIN